MGGAAPVLRSAKNARDWIKSGKLRKNAYQGAENE